MLAVDTTLATAGDRIKIYVNGEQITSFATSDNPNQNQTWEFNSASVHEIGRNASSSYDGQMAHVNFVDGSQLTPTSFGETDATTGIWKPKTSPSVSYCTNGFFLEFDNSANMGLDTSGQSNNFTTNGTIIQTKDTPSNIFAANNNLW